MLNELDFQNRSIKIGVELLAYLKKQIAQYVDGDVYIAGGFCRDYLISKDSFISDIDVYVKLKSTESIKKVESILDSKSSKFSGLRSLAYYSGTHRLPNVENIFKVVFNNKTNSRVHIDIILLDKDPVDYFKNNFICNLSEAWFNGESIEFTDSFLNAVNGKKIVFKNTDASNNYSYLRKMIYKQEFQGYDLDISSWNIINRSEITRTGFKLYNSVKLLPISLKKEEYRLIKLPNGVIGVYNRVKEFNDVYGTIWI
jgi:hypothetical protein